MEKCLALLDSAKSPVAVRMALEQALSSRGLFFLGSIADHPAVASLKGTDTEAWIRVMELFCHGTYAEYKADRKTLPELGERAVDKLKQLSLMTLAATSPRLAYSDVQAELDLGSVAAVEDLVINCVDAGLMEARLSQRDQAIVVQSVRGRELAVDDIPAALAKLDAWQDATQTAIRRVEAMGAAASEAFKSGTAAGKHLSGEVGRRAVLAIERGEAGHSARGASHGRAGGRGTEGQGGMFGGVASMLGLGGGRRPGGRH